jgi:hypothetical protein
MLNAYAADYCLVYRILGTVTSVLHRVLCINDHLF